MGCIFSHSPQHSLWQLLSWFRGSHSPPPPPSPSQQSPRQSPSDEFNGTQFSPPGFNGIVSTPSQDTSWRPWGELPEELLILIFQRIPYLSDFQSCLVVCTWWRSTAKILVRRTAATPFILSLNYQKLFTRSGTVYAYNNAPTAVRIFDLDPPLQQDYYTIPTSYSGWLLLRLFQKFKEPKFCLYNPVTRVIVKLPPPPKSFLCRLITSTTPADPNCIIYILFGLSHNLLCFCKPGDTSYEIIKFPENIIWISDIVFYKGELYAVDLFGALYVFKHDQNLWQNMAVKLERQLPRMNILNSSEYNLVEEPGTGQLLLVVPILLRVSIPGKKFPIRKTESLQIYKWKGSSKAVWEEMKNFRAGDHRALLLASGDSVFVSTLDQDFFKPNCIYFFQHSYRNLLDNVSVYDLENHKVVQQPYPKLQINSNCVFRSSFCTASPIPYRWFRASNM